MLDSFFSKMLFNESYIQLIIERAITLARLSAEHAQEYQEPKNVGVLEKLCIWKMHDYLFYKICWLIICSITVKKSNYCSKT